MFWPTIPPQSRKEIARIVPATVSYATLGADEIISRFLERGDYRIVPDDGANFVEAIPDEKFEALDGDLATEELARIYLSQGLVDEAKEILHK
jgi:hypothetical protein